MLENQYNIPPLIRERQKRIEEAQKRFPQSVQWILKLYHLNKNNYAKYVHSCSSRSNTQMTKY